MMLRDPEPMATETLCCYRYLCRPPEGLARANSRSYRRNVENR